MKKVLVVDDSVFVRRFLTGEVEKIDGLEVAGTARNGLEALKVIQEEQVDLITMDIEMPEMNGFQTLKKLNSQGIQIPVLVVSSVTPENSEPAARAMELGAVDVLPKPAQGSMGLGIEEISDELKEKLTALVARVPERKEVSEKVVEKKRKTLREKFRTVEPRLLIIGGSTGAPPFLHSIVSHLPSDFPLPVVIVQHMRKVFLEGLANNLQNDAELEVNLVRRARELKKGNIYLPGDNKHLLFRSGGEKAYVRLKDGEEVSGAKPSVDVAFQSARDTFKKDVIAVILTGMGKDGAEGMEKLYETGALCLGQDQESSAVYGMPREAAARGALDLQAPGDKIPGIITDWVSKSV